MTGAAVATKAWQVILDTARAVSGTSQGQSTGEGEPEPEGGERGNRSKGAARVCWFTAGVTMKFMCGAPPGGGNTEGCSRALRHA